MELTDSEFKKVTEFVYSYCGIHLHDGKKEMVKARLGKQMRLKGFTEFEPYFRHVMGDESGNEIITLINAISTNLTSFFRESKHFDYLQNKVIPSINDERSRGSRVRVWCAGCSTGEEAYTLCMVFLEQLRVPSVDFKILATDISTRVLELAVGGTYSADRMRGVPPDLVRKYFMKGTNNHKGLFRVKEQLREPIRFARLNLMQPFPMRGPFDVIFCRNVMIYFDQPSRESLVEKFFNLLGSGGHLFVGHSESLTGIRHSFKYVGPSIYRR